MSQVQFKKHKSCKNKFTIIPNELIRSNLGNSAFRFLCYLHSNTETWEVYQSFAKKELGWGREMIRGAIKELVEKNYLTVSKKHRSEKGQFSSNTYEWSLEPMEDSNKDIDKNDDSDSNSNNFSIGGLPTGGELPLTNTNTKEEQYKGYDNSSSPSSLRSKNRSIEFAVQEESPSAEEGLGKEKDLLRERIAEIRFSNLDTGAIEKLSKKDVNRFSDLYDWQDILAVINEIAHIKKKKGYDHIRNPRKYFISCLNNILC